MGRRTIRSTIGALVLAVGIVALPAAALAQEAGPSVPTLAQAMTGAGGEFEIAAFTAFDESDDGSMLVELEVSNAGDDPATFSLPYGTLLETGVEGDQTFATAGPPDDPAAVQAAARGEAPTLTAPPGDSGFMLTVFCTQRDDGAPFTRTPLHYAGMAIEPLPTVLRNIVAQDADPSTAQDAVWWVTDEPTYPVPDDIAPLLDGVAAAEFAAEPHSVIPDTQYTPAWERAAVIDESFDGGSPTPASPLSDAGSGANLLFWLVILGSAVAVVAVAMRLGRRRSAPLVVTSTMKAGWYPDPWGSGGHRYWDGRGWTDKVMR